MRIFPADRLSYRSHRSRAFYRICHTPFCSAAGWWCRYRCPASRPGSGCLHTAAQRTYNRRHAASVTAAKLVANHPARHRTGDAVFILYRTTMSHRDIAAFLTRRFHGFFNRCTGDHLRILRAAIQHVETSDSCNAQRGSHAYPLYPPT